MIFSKNKKKNLKRKASNSNEEKINDVKVELDKLKKQVFKDYFQKWMYRLEK